MLVAETQSCAVAATFQHISKWALLYIYDLTRLQQIAYHYFSVGVEQNAMYICSIGIPTNISCIRVRRRDDIGSVSVNM